MTDDRPPDIRGRADPEHARSGTWPSKLPGELPPDPDPDAEPEPTLTPTPELIQLLTPEGERTEHPDYPLELTR